MAELGNTADPKALVPGEPEQVMQTVQGFRRYGHALITAGNGLRSITTDGWEGEAGDAFRRWFDGEPERWLRCGDAFHDAAGVLDRFSYTLSWAQRQAAEAIALWEQGEAATEQAKAEHAQAQAQANQQAAAATAAGMLTVAPSIPFTDPGEEMRAQAQHLLDNARNQLRSAGDEASGVVGQARDKAPPEPSLLGKVTNFAGEFAAGVWEGAFGLAEFAWSISPTRGP